MFTVPVGIIMIDYPFSSNYLTVSGYSMHYLDEGPAHGPAFLLLHGVPSWSYIYRHFIPPLVQTGFRVICPDLIGFGKSEKITSARSIHYQLYLDSLNILIHKLQPSQLIIYGQDWGANFALHLAVENPDLIKGVVVSNGTVLTGAEKLPRILQLWKLFVRYSPFLPVGSLINLGCSRSLSRQEKKAYDAPFRNSGEKTAIRVLPGWIPDNPNGPHALRGQKIWTRLKHYSRPVLCIASDKDPFTKGYNQMIHNTIPGAKNQNHQVLPARHFIQEDLHREIAILLMQFADQFAD